MQNFRQEWGTIHWTNGTGVAVAAGDVVSLNGRVGIAKTAIAAGAVGAVAVMGVFRFAKDSSNISADVDVFLADASGEATTSPVTDDLRLGVSVAAAGSSAAYVDVDLNIARTGGGVGTAIDSGAGDAAGNFAAVKSIIAILQNAGLVKRA